MLVELPKYVERFVCGVAAAAPQDADGLVDDRSGLQRGLQLGGQPLGWARICASRTNIAAVTANS